MDGVSVASGIAGLITLTLQVGDSIYAYVTALKDKSKNIKELHNELLLLCEVLGHMRDFLNEQDVKDSGFDDGGILQQAITDCRVRIERIGDRLKPPEGGKMVQIINKLKWPFEQSEVLQLMENLRRFRSTFEFAANIQGYRILSKTSDDARESLKQLLDLSRKTEEMYAQNGLVIETMARESKRLEAVLCLLPLLAASASEVREVSRAVQLAEINEQEERTSRILDWIAPIEVLHKHRDVQARRSPGTGEWFFELPEFCRWVVSDDKGDLVCVGGPGVGKSVLVSLVIDKLKAMHKDHHTAVLFFYCDYSEQNTQTPMYMATSLLRQLCTHLETIPPSVAKFYQETRNEVKDQMWLQELQRILRSVIATFSKAYLIIDAIDETEAIKQRPALLDIIRNVRLGANRLKVFATTRPHITNLQERLCRPQTIQVSANMSDLRHHLGSMIDSHPDASEIMDHSLKQEIVNRLCETANGMFLLPSLHVQNILDQPTRADVKESLRHLSADLTEVFSTTMGRIRMLPTSRRNVALGTLMWISHTMRPLKLEELQHALAVRPDAPFLNNDNFIPGRTILDCCCGLVQLDRDSNIIRLVHYTLEEYLQSQDHDLFENAHQTIVETCLKYMSMETLKPLPFKRTEEFERDLQTFTFLEYSVLYWGRHARQVPIEQYSDLALQLLNKSQSLLVMARLRDAKTADLKRWMCAWAYAHGAGAAISIACSFGLTDLVRLIVSQQANPNLIARNMYGSTPLHETAILGFNDTAELLIAHGADVMDQNKGRATPFYLAISYGRLSTAKALLKYNHAQLNTHCRGGFTPLHRATDLCSQELVEWLLQEGALVNEHNDKGLSALHLAALHGSVSIAQMLVSRGAEIFVTNKEGLTPLDLAAVAGHHDIVQYLLENGADSQHRSRDGWTPLLRAARGGHVDSVVLLLESGADVLLSDRKLNLPLHHAARAGHLETVIQLLEYDPDSKEKQLFSRDRKGDTPRDIAFYCANYGIHKYLRGQEWEIRGAEPTTSSQMTVAIESGDLKQVQRLLDDNPSLIETIDEDGQPPLHVAIQEGQMEIVRMLLGRAASVEATGFHGWRSLHIAASLGNLDMVNILLAHGADVHSRTSSSQTVLHKAAGSHSLATVQRVLDVGADLHAINSRYMDALHIAAHKNDIAIARYLVLQCEMDVLARDKFNQTPAMWAEKSGRLEVASFLKAEERKVKKERKERLEGDTAEDETLNQEAKLFIEAGKDDEEFGIEQSFFEVVMADPRSENPILS